MSFADSLFPIEIKVSFIWEGLDDRAGQRPKPGMDCSELDTTFATLFPRGGRHAA